MNSVSPSSTHEEARLEVPENELNLLREKLSHIIKSARSATLANVLVPLLCYPMFKDDVTHATLLAWIGLMLTLVTARTWVVFSLSHDVQKMADPQRDLKKITWVVGWVGFGWAMGWLFIAPQLVLINKMIYVYGTTAAMISGIFAFSVYLPTFYAFNAPIMLPSLYAVLSSEHSFGWPFAIGMASIYLIVIGISRNFAKIFDNSVRLRFKDEILYRALVVERDQSISANLSKSKFIAIASHDLRQPMHAVNVYLECLDLEKVPDPERTSIKKIKNSIGTLNSMFESLLNISKLDSHITQVNFQPFELNLLVGELRNLYETHAKEKGLNLIFSYQDEKYTGDKILLQQILANLISNAIQYTAQGFVKIEFENKNQQLHVKVHDSGCGIAEKEQAEVFKEFYRTENTRNLHDGLGLGLSIVKKLGDLIGAEISVESDLGVGTTFTVNTPFALVQASKASDETGPSQAGQDIHRKLQGKVVALVEDDETILDAYRQVLASKGAQVVQLSEVTAELENQLEKLDVIDFILSDYRLKRTSGDLIIQKLRENYNQEIPALIVTADTSPGHVAMFNDLNVPVLYKPVSFQEIVSKIEKMIA